MNKVMDVQVSDTIACAVCPGKALVYTSNHDPSLIVRIECMSCGDVEAH